MFLTKALKIAALAMFAGLPVSVSAAQLVMVESPGCQYCIAWKRDIGPIYPKTEAGKFAPLLIVDKSDPAPFAGGYVSPIIYTPTFVLVENDVEIGRIQGYPGEDFFWGILEKMLADTTDFEPPG